MSVFLSGWINIKTKQPEMADLRSHSVTQNVLKWTSADVALRREWAWPADDDGKSLVVRTSPDDKPGLGDNLRAALLVRWATRNHAVQEAIVIVAKHGGSLDLSGCPIKALPDGIRVGGSIYLCGCPNDIVIPRHLRSKIIR